MRGDRSELFVRFALADRLHKTLDEINAMPVEQFAGWQAYMLTLRDKRKQTSGG
jgi:hypothetical protein